MKHIDNSESPQYGQLALRGALLGLTVTFGYALFFWLYAVLRASTTLWETVNDSAGLVWTWLATVSSLAIAILTIAAILSLVVVPIGAATAVLIVWLSKRWNRASRPAMAAAIGAIVTGIMAVLLITVLQFAGLQFTWRFWEAWSLWLIVPLVLFVLAGGAASWEWNREQSWNQPKRAVVRINP